MIEVLRRALEERGLDGSRLPPAHQVALAVPPPAQGYAQASVEPEESDYLQLDADALALAQCEQDPRFVRLQNPEDPAKFEYFQLGQTRVLERETAAGRTLLVIAGNQVWEQSLEPVEDFSAWRESPSTRPGFSIPAPGLSDLDPDATLPDWLRSHAETRLALGTRLGVLAGLGALSRLAPVTLEPTEQQHVSDRIGVWFRSLADRERAFLEHAAMERVELLESDLVELTEVSVDEPSAAQVLAFLHARDDLESILMVFWSSTRAVALQRRLRELDDEVLISLSALPQYEEHTHDSLLRAVFVSDPDAWWGGFSDPGP
jgi:hypothetical protein